jgi:glycosyltransferase involved in cell wall biosynthesis
MEESEDTNEAGLVALKPIAKVDVLIPFHRIDSYLEAAIASAQGSLGVEVRVIAINDSGQEVTKVLLGLRAEDLLVKSLFKGYLGALSTGFANCEADFIAFLDSDDLQQETRLLSQVELMNETDADISSCELRKFVTPLDFREVKPLFGSVPQFVEPESKLILGAYGADSSLVIRVATLREFEYLHREYPQQLADYFWLIQMLLGGKRYVHSQEGNYYYRIHGGQISRDASLQDVWSSVFPIWHNFLNTRLKTQIQVSPNLGLLMAFPSSLTKVSRKDLSSLRQIKRYLLKKELVRKWQGRVRLEILFGVREIIGRRGLTLKTLWVGPYLLVQVAASLMSGNRIRRNK